MEITSLAINEINVTMTAGEALAMAKAATHGLDQFAAGQEWEQMWLMSTIATLQAAGKVADLAMYSQVYEGQRILQWFNEENLEELRHRENIREVLGEECLDEYMRNMKAGKVKIERIDR